MMLLKFNNGKDNDFKVLAKINKQHTKFATIGLIKILQKG